MTVVPLSPNQAVHEMDEVSSN